MKPLSAGDIRASLINCSKGEAARLALPRDLAEQPWDDLDFLGWRDPSGADRGFVVAESVAESGDDLIGVVLRCVPPPPGGRYGGGRLAGSRASMCSLCLTTLPGAGVTLMAAARRAKRDDSVGIRICADLACSLYVRGKKDLPVGGRLADTLSVDRKAERIRGNLAAFLARI
jgi:hypothetical protein